MRNEILVLRTTIYHVSDLEQAKAWYSKAFDTNPYFDEPFYVGFNIEGFELGLIPKQKKSKDNTDSVFTYWGVRNIESVYNNLLKLGAKSHEAPNNVGGKIMVATVRDPWNNILGIIYNPEFKITI